MVRAASAVLLVALLLAGCGGGDSDGSSSGDPLPLTGRLLKAGDLDDLAPAQIAEAAAKWDASSDLGPWAILLPGSPSTPGPFLAEAGRVAGRWQPLNVTPPNYAYSLVAQFDSERAAAKRAKIVRDNLGTASITAKDFDVDIPDAEAAAGSANGVMSRLVAFSDGKFAYVVGATSPTSFTDEQVRDAAEALYERVKGRPAPPQQ
jgi:hypothetical protein